MNATVTAAGSSGSRTDLDSVLFFVYPLALAIALVTAFIFGIGACKQPRHRAIHFILMWLSIIGSLTNAFVILLFTLPPGADLLWPQRLFALSGVLAAILMLQAVMSFGAFYANLLCEQDPGGESSLGLLKGNSSPVLALLVTRKGYTLHLVALVFFGVWCFTGLHIVFSSFFLVFGLVSAMGGFGLFKFSRALKQMGARRGATASAAFTKLSRKLLVCVFISVSFVFFALFYFGTGLIYGSRLEADFKLGYVQLTSSVLGSIVQIYLAKPVAAAMCCGKETRPCVADSDSGASQPLAERAKVTHDVAACDVAFELPSSGIKPASTLSSGASSGVRTFVSKDISSLELGESKFAV